MDGEGALPALDTASFRQALASFLTGVAVATTVDSRGSARGLTVNSFTSVSLEPPLVLFCIADRAGSYEAFAESSTFVINVLAYEQLEVAKLFARPGLDKFAGLATRPGLGGAPVLDGCAAWFECTVYDRHQAGDHQILIGEVVGFGHESRRPLGYGQGGFLSLSPEQSVLTSERSEPATVSWIIETPSAEVILRQAPGGTWELPSFQARDIKLGDEWLIGRAEGTVGVDELSAPLLFSVYDSVGGDGFTFVYRVSTAAASSARLAPGCVAVPISDLGSIDWVYPVTAGLLGRYIRERDTNSFGIYAGSEASGRVAPVASDGSWVTLAEERGTS